MSSRLVICRNSIPLVEVCMTMRALFPSLSGVIEGTHAALGMPHCLNRLCFKDGCKHTMKTERPEVVEHRVA